MNSYTASHCIFSHPPFKTTRELISGNVMSIAVAIIVCNRVIWDSEIRASLFWDQFRNYLD